MPVDGLNRIEVQLGHDPYFVSELPFRLLKGVLVKLRTLELRMASGELDETSLDLMLEIVAVGVGVPAAALADTPIRLDQLKTAVQALASVSGLTPKEEGDDPNGSAATTSTGTIYTPSSPLLPAGPGT